jgi:hypothetical protein
MIHMLQVLCGPKRHAIYGIMYDDKDISPADAMKGMELLVEEEVALGKLNRRCEVCDKPVFKFLYEDGITKEQDWAKAKAISERLQAEQMVARESIMTARKARNN